MSAIDPTARIAAGAVLGKNVTVGAYCTIGPDVAIGDDCRLEPHVHITGHTTIGARTAVYPFASLGTPPQSVHYQGEPTRLEIGTDCSIREYVTMNIGTSKGRGVTKIGNHCYFMVSSHVGHDCIVGDHVFMANCVPLGGFAEVGDHVFLGGLSAVQQFTRIGAHAMVGGAVGVTANIIPFAYAIGHRAELAGINRVGLRRRGFSANAIGNIRKAYQAIFHGPGLFADRVEQVAKEMADDVNAMAIVDFIRASKGRPVAIARDGGVKDSDGE